MATSYHVIYNAFLASVADYDMLERSQNVTERDLHHYMNQAAGEIEDMVLRTSQIDLTKRDDVKQEFEADLPIALINLIVTGMDFYWFHPYYLNTEHMRNNLTTKDFSQYANHNMLFRTREVNEDLEKAWRCGKAFYSQRYGELRRMVQGGR